MENNVGHAFVLEIARSKIPSLIEETYPDLSLEVWSGCEYEMYADYPGMMLKLEGTDLDQWEHSGGQLYDEAGKKVMRTGTTSEIVDSVTLNVVVQPKAPSRVLRRGRAAPGQAQEATPLLAEVQSAMSRQEKAMSRQENALQAMVKFDVLLGIIGVAAMIGLVQQRVAGGRQRAAGAGAGADKGQRRGRRRLPLKTSIVLLGALGSLCAAAAEHPLQDHELPRVASTALANDSGGALGRSAVEKDPIAHCMQNAMDNSSADQTQRFSACMSKEVIATLIGPSHVLRRQASPCMTWVYAVTCRATHAATIGELLVIDEVKNLDLSMNSITTVSDTDLQRFTALQVLSIEKNPLTQIAPGALAANADLAVLLLADTCLDQLPASIFYGTPQLRVFDASRSSLGFMWLNSAPFAGLVHLHTVRLSELDPPLLGVNERAFANTTLRTIDLTGNMVQSVRPAAFAGVLDLHSAMGGDRVLFMAANPSICTIDPTTVELNCTCSDGLEPGPDGIVQGGNGVSRVVACGGGTCDSSSALNRSLSGYDFSDSRPCEVCGPTAPARVESLVLRWDECCAAADASTTATVLISNAPIVGAVGTEITSVDMNDGSLLHLNLTVTLGTNDTTVYISIDGAEAIVDVSCSESLLVPTRIPFPERGSLAIVRFATDNGRDESHCPSFVPPQTGVWNCGDGEDLGVCALACPDGGYDSSHAEGLAVCVNGELLGQSEVRGCSGTGTGAPWACPCTGQPDLPYCEYQYADCADYPPTGVPGGVDPPPCEICSSHNYDQIVNISFRWEASDGSSAVSVKFASSNDGCSPTQSPTPSPTRHIYGDRTGRTHGVYLLLSERRRVQ